MRLREGRPFLCENKRQVALVRAGVAGDGVNHIQNMLHDSSLLVVGFLNEEGVVRNPLGGPRGGFFERGNRIRRGQSSNRKGGAEREKKQRPCGHDDRDHNGVRPGPRVRLRTFSAPSASNRRDLLAGESLLRSRLARSFRARVLRRLEFRRLPARPRRQRARERAVECAGKILRLGRRQRRAANRRGRDRRAGRLRSAKELARAGLRFHERFPAQEPRRSERFLSPGGAGRRLGRAGGRRRKQPRT